MSDMRTLELDGIDLLVAEYPTCSAAVFDDAVADYDAYGECGRPSTGWSLHDGTIDGSVEFGPALYRSCEHHTTITGTLVAALVARIENGEHHA